MLDEELQDWRMQVEQKTKRKIALLVIAQQARSLQQAIADYEIGYGQQLVTDFTYLQDLQTECKRLE